MPAILVRILPIVALFLSFPSGIADDTVSVRETPLVRAVRECRKSVVNIHTQKSEVRESDGRFFTPKERRVTGMGTGIVVDERGYIVTNYHVIDKVSQITVTLEGGETLTAKFVDGDKQQDLAIIRVHASHPLTVMPTGTSSDLMLAEQVFAVGNAFGYEHTVTAGIISHVSRDVEVDETQSYKNLIQTDASINPGNSGGPLLNLDGEVIGINVAIRAGAQRIGFAIPIDDARRTIAHIISTERRNGVTHGMVGTDIATPDRQELVVNKIVAGSPAARSGLQRGDVIRQVRDVTILDSVDWERSLLDIPGGSILDVKVDRDGESIPLKFTVARGSRFPTAAARSASTATRVEAVKPSATPSPFTATDQVWNEFGLRLIRLSDRDRRQLPSKYRGGMKVMLVRRGGIASRHGVLNGDILLGLDGYETLDDSNLQFILNEDRTRGRKTMSFQIYRHGRGAMIGTMDLSISSATNGKQTTPR